MTVQTAGLVTAEEFAARENGEEQGRSELLDGEIVHMAPAGAEHGDVTMEIAFRIKAHVDANDLGRVFAAETGFTIARNPDTTRAPDVSFVRKSRLPAAPVRGFFEGAPDLAVEVVSPSDALSAVRAKVERWLAAGTVSIWVVDPPSQTIEIYRGSGQPLFYRASDEVSDEPTLPGFRLSVREMFPFR